MNILAETFPAWTQALGWTLLHSLWQSLLIFGLVMFVMRLIPSGSSHTRYVAACSGMAMMLAVSIATFIYLLPQTNTLSTAASQPETSFISFSTVQLSAETNFITTVQSTITSNMHVIILCWLVGTFFFSVRLFSGWWYISRLRAEAISIGDPWKNQLEQLAREVGINRLVLLAESHRVDAPMVLGYLKPIVLLPAGMLSGISTQQLETILLHELAHIRRHDYIINLFQSLLETIFFFNPFVWMISSAIRREREFCCDDEVVRRNGSPLTYAKALAQLEEIRHSKPVFALSLAENKNQLLNRIKRIMEKSAKNYSGRERIIPAALIIIGLICASWLTISTDAHTMQQKENDNQVAADTLDKKKQKSARYSRKSITTYDKNGQPHKEITETFEGDEDLRPLVELDESFDFDMPQFPVFPDYPGIANFPPMPDFDLPVPLFFNLDGDSVPKPFGYRSEREWEEFSEAFEKRFQEKFGDFYRDHEKEFAEMMKDLEENFDSKFDESQFEWMEKQAHAQTLHADALRKMQEEARKSADMAREHMERWKNEQLEHIEEQVEAQRRHAVEMEKHARKMEANVKEFENEARDMLIKDGYIDKGEKIESIKWDDDGNMKVNGKKIKESDQEKYRSLHKKYFKGTFEYSE